MRISDFLKRYNLHGSLINNVEYDSTTKRVSIETELCKWQQFDYDETKDPEMIEGFIVFEDVTYLKQIALKTLMLMKYWKRCLFPKLHRLKKLK